MATEVDDRVGSLVDERYRILEPMAEGSMGAVYKAEREPVGKLVAVKFLHASYAQDAGFLARFERETQVMSKLAHPNCVSVVDFGVWKGTPYLVMEYVGGRTLRRILDDGALPVARALAIARQIVAGLAHAHAQGITHRDVKPANIMISDEIGTGEHVRILDFGLARLRGAAGSDATQTNIVVGTPNYMAPEQTIGGGLIDARTDIYAVGIVLFEMISGDRPFQAEDTLNLLAMHRAAPVPRIADRVPAGTELPEGLQQVIEKAMSKSPDDRYSSAIALAEAIDGLIGRPTTPTDPRGHPVAKQAEPVAIAPTLLDLGSRSEVATVVTHARPDHLDRPGLAATTQPSLMRRRRSGSRVGMFLALAVLGGGAYAAYRVQHRVPKAGSAADGSGEVARGPDDPVAGGSGGSAAGETPDRPGGGDPVAGGSGGSAAGETPDRSGAGSGEPAGGGGEPGGGSGGPAEPDPAGSGAGATPEGEVENVPSPQEATNPDPVGGSSAEDEDENAPKSQEDVEQRVKPAAPALATTISGAVKLIQDGKREVALASLQALHHKQPRSAYIPFLLGNLYFDQRWWSVAMDNYRIAITRNGGYRFNAVLIRNVIRMLISKKTDKRAEYFLRKTIGKPARPYLQQTAKTDANPYLRGRAGAVARTLR